MEAPRERVWDIISDLERHGEWMVDVRRLEVVGEPKRGEGALIRVTSELFGLPLIHDAMVVTRWRPPERLEVRHRGQFDGAGAFILDDAPDGTTFTWIEQFRPPVGPLGEIAFALIIGPHLRRVFARSMANVKELSERGQ